MLSTSTVLSWPYEDLPQIEPAEACNFTFPVATFELVSGLIKESTKARRSVKPWSFERPLDTLRANYISTTDRSKGFAYECSLVRKLQAMGLECHEVSQQDNYMHHIDIEIALPAEHGEHDKVIHVDVKSPCALRKARPLKKHQEPDPLSEPQNRYVCMQLDGRSSLYNGLSDYIAFGQTDGTFLFVRRHELLQTVQEKMAPFLNGTLIYRSAWPECSLWVPYVRSFNGVHTLMTFMDLNDLPIDFKV